MTGGAPPRRPTSGGPGTSSRPRSGRPRSFRDRRTLLGGLVAGMLVGLVLLAWTGLQSHATASSAPPTSASGSSPTAIAGSGALDQAATRQAIGRIGTVTTTSAAGGTDFTLRTDAGKTIDLEVAPGTDTGVPPGWLQQHATSGAPVQVSYHLEAGRGVVDHLADAPAGAAPSGNGGTP